jgi:hypothetical protein
MHHKANNKLMPASMGSLWYQTIDNGKIDMTIKISLLILLVDVSNYVTINSLTD